MAWSDSENSRFEDALATYAQAPDIWERVAAAVGGGRTVDDVRRHFVELGRDLHAIETNAQRQAGYSNGTAQNNNNNNRRRGSNNNRANGPQT
ncbi:hypothetical protein ACP4OV_001872 [Aristida adscensionis]